MARLTSRQMIDILSDAVERAGREAAIRYGLDRYPDPTKMTPEQKVAADIRSVVSCYVQGIPFERRLAMPEMKRMSSKKTLAIFRDVVDESSRLRVPGRKKSAKAKRLIKVARNAKPSRKSRGLRDPAA